MGVDLVAYNGEHNLLITSPGCNPAMDLASGVPEVGGEKSSVRIAATRRSRNSDAVLGDGFLPHPLPPQSPQPAIAAGSSPKPSESAPLGDMKSVDPTGSTLPESPRRQAAKWTVKTTRTVGSTLALIGSTLRRRIRSVYRSKAGRFRRLNDDLRALLSEAIFQVENDLEHRQPSHPQVAVMRVVRNRLYDDLGWNEPLPASLHHTP